MMYRPPETSAESAQEPRKPHSGEQGAVTEEAPGQAPGAAPLASRPFVTIRISSFMVCSHEVMKADVSGLTGRQCSVCMDLCDLPGEKVKRIFTFL